MAAENISDWGASAPNGVGALFYSVCKSTNDLASAYARTNETKPCWFIAGEQSAGKGRQGRIWASRPGNLYASLAFKPSLKLADTAAVPFLISLAIRDTLIELGATDADVRCKWPNDVLIRDRKVSGVLIESSAQSNMAIDYLVIGIGINLAHYPADALFPATSLAEVTEREVGVEAAFKTLSHNIWKRLDEWDVSNFAPVRREWLNAAWGLGQNRRISTATEIFDGNLTGLDEQGGLLVRLADGTERTILVADVFPANT